MKSIKLIYSLVILVVAGLFAACTPENPYTPGEVPAGPQVSFSKNNETSILITGDEGEASPTILLTRIDAEGELVVPIGSNAEEHLVGAEETENEEGTTTRANDEYIFEVPNNVTFKAGEKEAKLVIKVLRPDALVEDKDYELNFFIKDDKLTTIYGANEWSVNIKLFPWDLVKTNSSDTGKFRAGDVFSTIFNVNTVLAEVDVKIYKHKTKAGVYLVYDPWAAVMAPTFGYESAEAVAEDLSYTSSHLVINCADPKKCYIEKQFMGVDLGPSDGGKLYLASDYQPNNTNGIAGELDTDYNVLTWPANGLLITAGGSNYKCNPEGAFRLVFPGGEAVDYTLSVNYEGMNISPDIQNVTARFTFTYGANVTGIKYFFAEGNILANPSEAIASLMNGTAKDIYTIEDIDNSVTTKTIDQDIKKSAVYTIVAVPMDKHGSLVERFVSLYSFYYSGLGDTGSFPCEIEVIAEDFTTNNADNTDTEIGNHNALSYTVKGKSLKSAFIGCWPTSTVAEHLKAGKKYNELFKDNNYLSLSIEELAEANSEKGYVGNINDLEAETDYTIIVLAVNDYEESGVADVIKTTSVAPEYAGELKIGKYLWVNKSNNKTYETTFEVKSYQGSSKKFLVSNIGYNDGLEWLAEYDAEAGTLTLDGTVRGRKSEGNLFGVELTDGETVYIYLSVLPSNPSSNANPLIFTVDKNSKALTAIQNTRFAVYTRKDGKNTPVAEFNNTEKTTITPYVEGSENEGAEGGESTEGGESNGEGQTK